VALDTLMIILEAAFETIIEPPQRDEARLEA
jgi:hypothetical protein